MSVEALLREVAGQGVELWVEGARLRFRSPRGALSGPHRTALASERGSVIAMLRSRAEAHCTVQPLSYNQRALWFIHQEAPASTAYHVAQAVRIVTPIRLEALHHALQGLSDRHPMLRTTYALSDDGLLQQHTRGAVDVAFRQLSAAGASDEAMHAMLDDEFARPFDLDEGPVFRASLITRADDEHLLLIVMHHIAGDGWSLVMMMDEFRALYAEACGESGVLPPRVDHTYADFVHWQESWLNTADGERTAALWQQTLAEPRAQMELSSDRPRPPRKSFRGGTHRLRLGAAETTRLRQCARENNVTLYVLLLSAWTALLYRLTGTQDVIVGSPALGRTQPRFERVVGQFVNTVPLRVQVTPDIAFATLLSRVSAAVHAALDGQDYPFQLMVQHAHVARDPSRSPLFETFFNLLAFEQSRGTEPSVSVGDTAGLRMEPYPLRQQEGQFDLSLQLTERNGELHGALLYSTDLYDAATMERLAAHYVALVEGVVVNAGTTVENLPPQAERLRPEQPEAPSAAVRELLADLALRDVRLTLDGEKLKVNAPVGALDDALKVRLSQAKAEVIAALRAPAAHSHGLRRVPRVAPLPISYAQQRLWFLDRMQPGNSHYNISLSLRLSGLLDVAALSAAIDQLPQRHEALRLRIRDVDGNPSAELMESVGSVVRFVVLTEGTPAERLVEARQLALRHAVLPYDLAVGPLVTALLIQLAPDDHVLMLGMHHIASDGWSLSVAAREICAEYDAAVSGQPSPLPALDIQYIDFAAWQREQLESGLLVQQLAFWQRELANATTLLELPTDRPRPPILTYRGSRRKHVMPAELLNALKSFSRAEDTTLYMTLLAAWQVLLHRYSGQDDIVVGSPMANRDDPALEPVIGCFVNNVVMRGRLDGNPRFADFLKQTRKVVLGAFDHREMPFDRLVEALRPERSTSHSPIFQVLFTLHSYPIDPAPLRGIDVELLQLDDDGSGTARFDLTLEMDEHEGGLRMVYEYATDLFDESTVARMHGQFLVLLEHVAGHASDSVADIPILTPADEIVVLDDANQTAFSHDRTQCVHALVAAAAARVPDAIAVQAPDGSLTYAQLERRANQMAQLLRERGVTDGALVGVCLDRIADLPVALLAVLKAGAAYVPIDPAHPAERLVYTLTDAKVACVITEERFVSLVESAHAPLLLVDADAGAILAQSSSAPVSAVGPRDLAYVIYTSGSTGRPKGVEVEHRNVVNFFRSMEREPGFDASDVLLAVTTPSFDIAGLEMFLPLVCGARTVIASRGDVLDGEQLIALLEDCHATVMQATPATWRLMLDAGWTGKRDLRVLCGGEAMPRDLARDLLTRTSVIWNMYGPTETTIWSTTHRVTDAGAEIPIGHPIGNTTVYVLDAAGRPAPLGVAGELCIGGEGVARGYRDRPELTAEKFVDVVLAGRAPERVYRTGDVVRLRADLTLEFVGRRDHQVKLRGYRIELGEIESILVENASVRRAVVIVREDAPGDQRLVAYVVPANGEPIVVETLRSMLRSRLPEYMLPSMIVSLAELPLTPNGKIDRKALPAPDALLPAPPVSAALSDTLMTEPQRRVAAIWRDVLRLAHVGVEDNFFDLGGHSLLVVKVHAALKREFQRELTLVDLFQHTTIAAQASLVLSDTTDRDASMQRARARAARLGQA